MFLFLPLSMPYLDPDNQQKKDLRNNILNHTFSTNILKQERAKIISILVFKNLSKVCSAIESTHWDPTASSIEITFNKEIAIDTYFTLQRLVRSMLGANISLKYNLTPQLQEDLIQKQKKTPFLTRESNSSYKQNKTLTEKDILEIIESTKPSSIDIIETRARTAFFNGKEYRFAVAKIAFSKVQQKDILQWQKLLKDNHQIHLTVRKARQNSGLKKQLISIANQLNLIEDPNKIKKLIDHINGKPPNPIYEIPIPKYYLENSLDLRNVPFVSIDPDHTVDIDDIVWASKYKKGKDTEYRVLIGFAAVDWLITPNSYYYKYAKRAVVSLYGKRNTLPLLGPSLSMNNLSLLPGQKRLAWIVDFKINDSGEIVHSNIFRAIVRSHGKLNHNTAVIEAQNNTKIGRSLNALFEATTKLNNKDKQKIKQSKIITPEKAISALMINAKGYIADLFAEKRIPVIYRVHSLPSKRQIRIIISKLARAGIKAKKRDFYDPQKLQDLLFKLIKQNMRPVLNEIIDYFVGRARFSVQNFGHKGLGLPAYLEIKGLRDFAGVVNQGQMRALVGESPFYTMSKLNNISRHLNRRRYNFNESMKRLIFLENLEERLKVKHPVIGTVIKKNARKLILRIPKFGYGVVFLPTHRDINLNELLVVQLKGYNPHSSEYVFRLVPAKELTR